MVAKSKKITRKDFASDQDVRWCPGCGDYAILATTQKLMPDLGVPREKIVFISGIGCASRFPYYMNTYGFHSIHGRAPTLATGLKISNPELMVFVVTGDGDGLSIGGNHLLHVLRRNLDLNILLFNNRVYGLTKGQYSPTSEVGQVTKSSPQGSLDRPINPVNVALAAEATFVARTIATDQKHLAYCIERAAKHRGGSFIEIYQNCNVYNDGAFDSFAGRDVRPEKTVELRHGEPLVFGKERDKAIKFNPVSFAPEVTTPDDPDVLVHDETDGGALLQHMFADMEPPDFPLPMGVLRCVERPTYEDALWQQVREAKEQMGEGDLETLLAGGETWDV